MFNKVFLLGRLGLDPEMRTMPNGEKVTNFTLASNNRYVSNGETKEVVCWHKIVVFGPQATTCAQYLSKGRLVFIEGEIRNRSYNDKNGIKKSVSEVIVKRIKFLGADNKESEAKTPDLEQEDIPF